MVTFTCLFGTDMLKNKYFVSVSFLEILRIFEIFVPTSKLRLKAFLKPHNFFLNSIAPLQKNRVANTTHLKRKSGFSGVLKLLFFKCEGLKMHF